MHSPWALHVSASTFNVFWILGCAFSSSAYQKVTPSTRTGSGAIFSRGRTRFRSEAAALQQASHAGPLYSGRWGRGWPGPGAPAVAADIVVEPRRSDQELENKDQNSEAVAAGRLCSAVRPWLHGPLSAASDSCRLGLRLGQRVRASAFARSAETLTTGAAGAAGMGETGVVAVVVGAWVARPARRFSRLVVASPRHRLRLNVSVDAPTARRAYRLRQAAAFDARILRFRGPSTIMSARTGHFTLPFLLLSQAADFNGYQPTILKLLELTSRVVSSTPSGISMLLLQELVSMRSTSTSTVISALRSSTGFSKNYIHVGCLNGSVYFECGTWRWRRQQRTSQRTYKRTSPLV